MIKNTFLVNSVYEYEIGIIILWRLNTNQNMFLRPCTTNVRRRKHSAIGLFPNDFPI